MGSQSHTNQEEAALQSVGLKQKLDERWQDKLTNGSTGQGHPVGQRAPFVEVDTQYHQDVAINSCIANPCKVYRYIGIMSMVHCLLKQTSGITRTLP